MVFQLFKQVVSLIHIVYGLTLTYKTNKGRSFMDGFWVEGRFYNFLVLSSVLLLVLLVFHRHQFMNFCTREVGTKALETN